MIQTYTGKNVDPFNLRQEDILIEDIAHSLSMQARGMGHMAFHYSVGLHSITLSGEVPKRLKKAALLHDASEAYLHDIITPFKHLLYFYVGGVLCSYTQIEDNIMQAIFSWADIPFSYLEQVKPYDMKLWEYEKSNFFTPGQVPYQMPTPNKVRNRFIEIFKDVYTN